MQPEPVVGEFVDGKIETRGKSIATEMTGLS
jgi:hypothetical protein